MKIPWKDEKGMTLLELLLSMVIIMIVITVFFQFFSQSAKFNVRNEEKLEAINIAREVISKIKDKNDKGEIQESLTLDGKCGELNEQSDLIEKKSEAYLINICFEDGPEQLNKVTVTVEFDERVLAETYTYVE